MAEHTLSAEPTHSRWNAALPPRLTVNPGDVVHVACQDASGAQVHPGMTAAEFAQIDRGRIHELTGPIAVRGAAPGDTLEVAILEVRHRGWGWTSLIPGLGLLRQRFREDFLFHWELHGAETRSLAPAAVPLLPFCGVMGVAPAERGEFRTRAPGVFGGNMDVRELCAGATLYLPVQQPGALFSLGDAHAAQGDGEVCINGIECPADVTLRLRLHKGQALGGPVLESAARWNATEESACWMVVESSPDAMEATRGATDRMVDLLAAHWAIDPVHAYILCSVAMRLQLSQVVNEPMITVAAAMPKSVLPPARMFGGG